MGRLVDTVKSDHIKSWCVSCERPTPRDAPRFTATRNVRAPGRDMRQPPLALVCVRRRAPSTPRHLDLTPSRCSLPERSLPPPAQLAARCLVTRGASRRHSQENPRPARPVDPRENVCASRRSPGKSEACPSRNPLRKLPSSVHPPGQIPRLAGCSLVDAPGHIASSYMTRCGREACQIPTLAGCGLVDPPGHIASS